MKTLRYALLMLAMALFAPAVLLAQAGAPPTGESGSGHHIPSVDDQLDNLSHKLNLTDAQKPQVKALLKDQRDQMVQIMDNSSGSREENRAKMRDIHEKYVANLRGILNAEQKAKFDKMEAEHHQHRGEEHGQSAPAPPPQQ